MEAEAPASSTEVVIRPFKQNIFNNCPGGLCEWIQDNGRVLLVVLALNGLVFLITLIPPLFSWSKVKADGKKRIFFAFLAFLTFYFWLAFLAVNSVYCFGFLAHEGPCKHFNRTSASFDDNSTAAGDGSDSSSRVQGNFSAGITPPPRPPSLQSPSDELAAAVDQVILDTNSKPQTSSSPYSGQLSSGGGGGGDRDSNVNESCEGGGGASSSSSISPHQAELVNLTCFNTLIIVVLIIVLIANAREALNAKALHYKETLCKKEEVQKFLSQLVSKAPEVGHYVTCFHPAKSPDVKTNATRKVVTFSAIENFGFQSWRDFSDVRLIDPSSTYPIIEIEIVLNFFPGDHYTAERYKAFVMQLTKEHSGKDAKINIDDYFHIEDHREWTFFIGNADFISPWWDSGVGRAFVSCVLLCGWPLRMGYHGQIAKHQVEVKKAVFCENSAQDEGVSLSATPGSNETSAAGAAAAAVAANGGNGSAVAAATAIDKSEDAIDAPDVAAAAAVTKEDDNSGVGSRSADSAMAMGDIEKANNTSLATATATTMTSPPSPRVMMHSQHQQTSISTEQNNPNPPCQLRLDTQQQQQQQQLQHNPQGNQQLVNAVISQPPPTYQQLLRQQHPQQQPQQSYYGNQQQQQQQHFAPPPSLRSQPLTSPRTHLRETTKDIVTAVTHQDINGVSAVNTIALKDIDVQMSALSGYETYV